MSLWSGWQQSFPGFVVGAHAEVAPQHQPDGRADKQAMSGTKTVECTGRIIINYACRNVRFSEFALPFGKLERKAVKADYLRNLRAPAGLPFSNFFRRWANFVAGLRGVCPIRLLIRTK